VPPDPLLAADTTRVSLGGALAPGGDQSRLRSETQPGGRR